MVIPPTTSTMGGLLDELRGDYPQLAGTRMWDASRSRSARARKITSEKIQLVDPSFFKVFDLPMAAGDKASLLQRPDDLLISEAAGEALFRLGQSHRPAPDDPAAASVRTTTASLGVLKDRAEEHRPQARFPGRG